MGPIHCQNEGPTTAGPTGTTHACDHFMDCSQFPDGWYPDPYNCRKYWHCYQGDGEHKTCPAGQLYNAQDIMCDLVMTIVLHRHLPLLLLMDVLVMVNVLRMVSLKR